MSTKVQDALQKVTALPGVKAAFVFDQFQNIVARDVPGQYSNDILKRIAAQLHKLALASWKNRVITHDFRLVYERYAVYARLFAQNFYLVVFMERNLGPDDFRQPLNLAVLVLDRALRGNVVQETGVSLAKVAEAAEVSLKENREKDMSFSGDFRRLCAVFLGQTGKDLVDMVLEEQYLFPPLRTEADMRKLRTASLLHVVHPLKKRILEDDSERLLVKALTIHPE